MAEETARRPVQNVFAFDESQRKSQWTSKSSPGWGALFRLEKEQIHLRHEIEIARLKDKLERNWFERLRAILISLILWTFSTIIVAIGLAAL